MKIKINMKKIFCKGINPAGSKRVLFKEDMAKLCLKIHEKITKIKVQKKYMNKISTNVRVRVRLAQN